MKMKTLVRTLLTVAVLALLAGCGHNDSSANANSSATQPSDDQIRRKIVGTWKLDSDPTNSITFNSDGTLSSTADSGHATWTLSNGVFTVEESGPTGETDAEKVVSIDDHICLLKDVGNGEGDGDVTKLDKQ